METQLAATRKRIDEIFVIRENSHDQMAMAAEYRTLTDLEAVLLQAIRKAST